MSDEDSVDWDSLEEGSAGPLIIGPEMLAKRLLWDISPCDIVEQTRDALGYSPASEEVEYMEHKESHARLIAASPIAPLVSAMAKHAASAVTASLMIVNDDPALAGVDLMEHVEKLYPIIFQSTFAIVAELLDVGAVHLPHLIFEELG